MIQNLVHKILPNLIESDLNAEEQFYATYTIPLKEEEKVELDVSETKISYHGLDKTSKISYGFGQERCVLLVPETELTPASEQLPALHKPFIRGLGRVPIGHICKYLAKKMPKEITSADQVEILCCGDPCGKELSLHFIQSSIWKQVTDTPNMVLHYRLKPVTA